MATLVENVDKDSWRIFTSICREEKILVGHKLTEILNVYIRTRKITDGEKALRET